MRVNSALLRFEIGAATETPDRLKCAMNAVSPATSASPPSRHPESLKMKRCASASRTSSNC